LTAYYSVDLRRFRSYQGTSVRDLLRAIRNKVSFPELELWTGLVDYTGEWALDFHTV